MILRFTRIHEDCMFDKNMARLIYYLWELCQCYSCGQVYNGDFSADMKYGRAHFVLTDFRLARKYQHFLDYLYNNLN